MKENECIRVSSEIIAKAKEVGLEISKFCENALEEGIKALEGSKKATLASK